MPQPRKSLFARPYVAIIERLIARRLELGITQAQLGKAFGEDQSFISRIERCQRRLDVYEYARFCRILKLDPAEPLRLIRV